MRHHLIIIHNITQLLIASSASFDSRQSQFLINREQCPACGELLQTIYGSHVRYRYFSESSLPVGAVFIALQYKQIWISSTFSKIHLILSLTLPWKVYNYIDDGLSTYAMTKTKLYKQIPQINKRVWRLMKINSPCDSILYAKALLLSPSFVTFPHHRTLPVNKSQILEVIQSLVQSKSLHSTINNSGNVCLIILPKTDPNQYLSTLKDFAASFNHVLIKPHPRGELLNDAPMYGSIIAPSTPIEFYYTLLAERSVTVIGPPSTALITANVIFNFDVRYIQSQDKEFNCRFANSERAMANLNIPLFTSHHHI